jgi:3-deoxy-D-manno-octulosonate 8-phosphate phosphatase KdsC-like HAD superfamily phosphatase
VTLDSPGGGGAAREMIERILRAQNRWEEGVRAYLEFLRRSETDSSPQ